jgi:Icc-related predicted phosphoesterase
MKVIYTSDLHGNVDFYQEMIDISVVENIRIVILGGDLLPKEGRLKNSLEIQKSFINNQVRYFLAQLKEKTNASVYAILGNDDWAATLPDFRKLEEEKLLNLLHGNTYDLSAEFTICGYPYVPPTPFSPKDFEKRDMTDDTVHKTTHFPAISTSGRIERIDEHQHFMQRTSIQEDMDSLYLPKSKQKSVCVMHAPPYKTVLDRLHDGRDIGSKAIRNFIDKKQPTITLHGHIHESPFMSGTYWQTIENTPSINPGQTGSRLSAVIFNLLQPIETLKHTLHKYYQPNFSFSHK